LLYDYDYVDDTPASRGRYLNPPLGKNLPKALSPLFPKKFLFFGSSASPLVLNFEDPYMHTLFYIATFAIVAKHSYWMKSYFPSNIRQSLKVYIKSNIPSLVSQQIMETFGNMATEIPSIINGNNDDYKEYIINPLLEIIKNNAIALK